MNFRNAVLVAFGCFTLVGCNQSETPLVVATPPTSSPTPAPVVAAAPKPVGIPQPKLQTIKLYIGDQVMETELAYRAHEVQTGMMFRTNMAENEGMLFVFAGPHQASFWMQNTLVPLSAAYINPDGKIEEIHKLEPLNTNSVTASSSNIQYVLETPQGWFERHEISTGSVIRTDAGTFKESFFNKQ